MDTNSEIYRQGSKAYNAMKNATTESEANYQRGQSNAYLFAVALLLKTTGTEILEGWEVVYQASLNA
jgi:hypothetical protein